MKRLTKIGLQTGTDKALYHFYTDVYEDIFSQYESPRILEVGIADGSSIRMYYKYFNNPYVVAMDINTIGPIETCKIVRGDQASIDDLNRCVDGEEPFDIILDDGGHCMHQQQITFGHLIKHVKSGGYFILEDIHTSFIENWLTPKIYDRTTYDMLRMIENKEMGFSNFIDEDTQKYILDRIDTMLFWSRVKDNFTDSATCIMKLK